MELINTIFQNLTFTKAESKGGYTTYAAGIVCQLAGGLYQMVLVFVPDHLASQQQANIKDLVWWNVQTRRLVNPPFKARPQKWVIPEGIDDVLLSTLQRTKDFTLMGSAHFPFEVKLLHDLKKKTNYQYNNSMFLTAALSTFMCSIDYRETIRNTAPSVSNWFSVEDKSYNIF